MNTRVDRRTRRFVAWALLSACFGGAAAPADLLAQVPLRIPKDQKEDANPIVDDSKVPAPVKGTARTVILDGRDVVYRKQDNGGKGRDIYYVNFTTPTKIRIQARIKGDGTFVDEPTLAPTQPDSAPPKREVREQLAREWAARVQAERSGTVSLPTPITPVPSVPARSSGREDLRVTRVTSRDLPNGVRRIFDQHTTGARDVRYAREVREGRTTYNVTYTPTSDNTRRILHVSETGVPVAGPYVVNDIAGDEQAAAEQYARQREAALERELAMDRLNDSNAEFVRVTRSEIPRPALGALDNFSAEGTDPHYRRESVGNRTAYSVHFVSPDGRRYWGTVNEDGTVRQRPTLSSFQPQDDRDARIENDRYERRNSNGGGWSSDRSRWAGSRVQFRDLPRPVQRSILDRTEGGRDQETTRLGDEDRRIFETQYTDAAGQRLEIRFDDQGDVIAGPRPARDNGPQSSGRGNAGEMERMSFRDLPRRVQDTVLDRESNLRDFATFRRIQNYRTVAYAVNWTDDRGRRMQIRFDEHGEVTDGPREVRD